MLERNEGAGAWDIRPLGLQPASIPVSIVCGPPASGKSTYVEQHKAAGDLVIDLDEIRAEVSGCRLYHATKRWVGPALDERNRRLRELAKPLQTAARCWFIVRAPTLSERGWWGVALGTETIKVLATKPVDCIDRINRDHRRPTWVKLEHARAVDKWWALFSVKNQTGAPNILTTSELCTDA
ncbi:MAG: AAA family ATPase [Acidobacteria bacterium]|nr:AAA family ATPase [Acidobacteriota bacterium]